MKSWKLLPAVMAASLAIAPVSAEAGTRVGSLNFGIGQHVASYVHYKIGMVKQFVHSLLGNRGCPCDSRGTETST